MELNISEFESDNFDDFDVNEMNELANSVNNMQNRSQVENPMRTPKNNTNNKVIAVNNMFQQAQTNQCQTQGKMQSHPTSCEVKRQLIKEHMQQQQPQRQQQQQKKQYQEETTAPITNKVEKSAVSYDDILSGLNVKIINGQMQFISPQNNANFIKNKQTLPQSQYSDKVRNQMEPAKIDPKANYIYNKYFNSHKQPETEPTILRPTTIEEYKEMVKKHIIERQLSIQRIKQIKSKKLIMPNSNIHISNPNGQSHPSNLNKLFGLMK